MQQGGLDWEMIAMVAAALSFALIGWDFVTARGGALRSEARKGLLEVAWPLADGARWHLVTNLGDRAVETAELPPGQPLYAHGLAPADAAARHALAPGAVLVALEAAHG